MLCFPSKSRHGEAKELVRGPPVSPQWSQDMNLGCAARSRPSMPPCCPDGLCLVTLLTASHGFHVWGLKVKSYTAL